VSATPTKKQNSIKFREIDNAHSMVSKNPSRDQLFIPADGGAPMQGQAGVGN